MNWLKKLFGNKEVKPAIEIDSLMNGIVYDLLDARFNDWVSFGWTFEDDMVCFYASDGLDFETLEPVRWTISEDEILSIYERDGLELLVDALMAYIIFEIGSKRYLSAEEVERELGSKEAN